MATPQLSLVPFFQRLRDPRRPHGTKHLLIDIIAITLCAVIADAEDWPQVVTFATEREDWLRTFLRLPNGIPAHDTFERVFDRINPAAFLACFQQWVQALTGPLGLTHIAIDGKTPRHSGNKVKGWKALHLVSAWATDCSLSLGQVAAEEKSDEITAIPRLLELLDLKGALVTIDAMGCQKEIARQIVEGGGDYVLVVKDNQPRPFEDVLRLIGHALDSDFAGLENDSYVTEGRGHGRREERSYLVVTAPTGIRDQESWEGLKVVGQCLRSRVANGKESEEVRYFIGSRKASARVYGEALRGHWGIENSLHWHLDVTFDEDGNRVQRRHGAENLAAIRRMAVSLLKQHRGKGGLSCKRYAASLNPAFLEEILLAGRNLGDM